MQSLKQTNCDNTAPDDSSVHQKDLHIDYATRQSVCLCRFAGQRERMTRCHRPAWNLHETKIWGDEITGEGLRSKLTIQTREHCTRTAISSVAGVRALFVSLPSVRMRRRVVVLRLDTGTDWRVVDRDDNPLHPC